MQNQKVGNKNIQFLEESRRNEQGVQKNQKVGQKVGRGIIQAMKHGYRRDKTGNKEGQVK